MDDLRNLDRSSLLTRARRQRRVLSVAALASGTILVVLLVAIVNAWLGGNVHVLLILAALVVGGTAVPAASTARRLGVAIREAEAAPPSG